MKIKFHYMINIISIFVFSEGTQYNLALLAAVFN